MVSWNLYHSLSLTCKLYGAFKKLTIKEYKTSLRCILLLFISYIIWFGDLNYRIEDLSVEAIKFLSSPKKLHVLLEKDQLKLSMRSKISFQGFQEGPVAFIPTYKYDFQTDDFDTRWSSFFIVVIGSNLLYSTLHLFNPTNACMLRFYKGKGTLHCKLSIPTGAF